CINVANVDIFTNINTELTDPCTLYWSKHALSIFTTLVGHLGYYTIFSVIQSCPSNVLSEIPKDYRFGPHW
ncbi:hypothetical protein Bhyg_11258, partial [Pseudolycoriella hygida]